MRLKTLALSVVVLAALAALAWYFRRPAPPLSADARIGQPLAERAVVEQAAKIRLRDQGRTVELARQADGTWRVGSYFDLPADFPKLTSFVAGLTGAKYQRLVTTNPGRIARLEFKDTEIALLDPAGKEQLALSLGKTAETGGGRFVRVGTEPKAYLADFSAWLDVEPKNWANPELLNLKAETVARIEIPFADGGTVVLSRTKKDDAWAAEKPADRKVRADRVTSLLGSVGNLRFSETSDPADAAVAAARANLHTVKLTTFDHQTITVAMGRKPEEKKLKPPAPAVPAGAPATGPSGNAPKADEPKKDGDNKAGGEAKPPAPEYETIPAGPVFAFVADSSASAPINALMAKRAFQVSDYAFTNLPSKPDELFEPPPPAKPDEKSAPADQTPAEKKP